MVFWARSGPPSAKAELTLSLPWPGIAATVSRGTESIAAVRFSGSTESTIIVSVFCVSAAVPRESTPRTRTFSRSLPFHAGTSNDVATPRAVAPATGAKTFAARPAQAFAPRYTPPYPAMSPSVTRPSAK